MEFNPPLNGSKALNQRWKSNNHSKLVELRKNY